MHAKRIKEILTFIMLSSIFSRSLYLLLYLDSFELFHPFTFISFSYMYENMKFVDVRSVRYEDALIPILSVNAETFTHLLLAIASFCCDPQNHCVEMLRLHILFFLMMRILIVKDLIFQLSQNLHHFFKRE